MRTGLDSGVRNTSLRRFSGFLMHSRACWAILYIRVNPSSKSLALKAALSLDHTRELHTHIYRDFFFFPAATAGRRAQQHRQAAQIK